MLIATTHLARNPESPRQIWCRGFQYGSLFRELLAFAEAHDAVGAPVVLTGDLNAQDVDELGVTGAGKIIFSLEGIRGIHVFLH